MSEESLTVSQAAARLGISERTLRKALDAIPKALASGSIPDTEKQNQDGAL
jgi:transcriptional antiterminator